MAIGDEDKKALLETFKQLARDKKEYDELCGEQKRTLGNVYGRRQLCHRDLLIQTLARHEEAFPGSGDFWAWLKSIQKQELTGKDIFITKENEAEHQAEINTLWRGVTARREENARQKDAGQQPETEEDRAPGFFKGLFG